MRRTLRLVVFPMLVLLIGALLASDRTPGWHDRPVSAEDIVLPFDEYRLTTREQVSVNRARHLLVTRCMRAAGFPDITVPPSLVGAVDPPPANSRRYGVDDESTVRRFGFHLRPDPASDKRSAELDEWLAGLSGPEELALYGTEKNAGCLDNAAATLSHGLPQADHRWLTDLDFKSLDRSREDPRVVAAIRGWRACMSRAGLDYAGPYEALADERWNLDSATISRREIDVATADVRCKNRARLVQIWAIVETEIQEDQIRRNPATFARLAEARRLTRGNAERIIDLAGA